MENWDLRQSILRPLVEAAKPYGHGLPEVDTGILVRFAIDFLGAFPAVLRFGAYCGLLVLLLLGPLLALRRFATFSMLSKAEGEQALEIGLRSSFAPLRELSRLTKVLATIGFYEQGTVMQCLGYDPDAWVAFAAQRRLELHGEDLK